MANSEKSKQSYCQRVNLYMQQIANKRKLVKNSNQERNHKTKRGKSSQTVRAKSEFGGNRDPHTPSQELTHFGTWVGKPIWVPPKDNNDELAKSMLNRFGPFASKDECWKAAVRKHRSMFTQVREFELPEASIRLPKGRLFVTVTEQDKFDTIEDQVPQCVQTRLDEFLAGPGKKRGVKVYYLKPLCVEIGQDLVFTTAEELDEAIAKIQDEVYAEYRRHYLSDRARRLAVGFVDAMLCIPRSMLRYFIDGKKREIDTFHAQLEFERRKRAMKAVPSSSKVSQRRQLFVSRGAGADDDSQPQRCDRPLREGQCVCEC